ncbi:MAG TPA: Rrf2 family transcriptional regulator [Clostridia bacterium]|nr:Rrf2 family transcriptional regulator [Clostridia bacterium]
MFSATSEYALRALSQLARLPRGTSMLGRDLSEATGVPGKYLSKVMLSLRNAGLVGAIRGSGGGYRLMRTPEAIRLLEVVELFEGRTVRPECILGRGGCSDVTACAAHAAWREVSISYLKFLQTTTLADISHLTAARVARAT